MQEVYVLNKLIIFDGNSIANRAFYGIKLLTNKDGIYTNAIYGFLNIFFKYINEENPTHICVAFDLHAPTFRHKAFPAYKAQRKGMPEELKQQMPILKEILKAMNITILEIEGYEADDVIGTVSKKCEDNDIKCIIITGDKDDLQLASKMTVIKLITTKMGVTDTVDYTDDTVVGKYGVTPSEFIDVKALMGDPSDNIPGVSGIGEKTAFSLIQKYKSLDALYDDVENKDISNGVKNKLISGKDSAYQSRFLSTIVRNVPINFSADKCIVKEYNSEELAKLFKSLNFTSFLKKLKLSKSSDENIKVSDDKQSLFERIKKESLLFYYFDNDSCFAATNADNITKVELKDLYPFFEDKNIKKISHDIKNDIVYLNSMGVNFENAYFDTMIAYYIIDPSANDYSLESVTLKLLGDVHQNKLADILSTYFILKEQIDDNCQNELCYDVEMPLIEVLASMQIYGIKVDKTKLLEFQSMLADKIESITADIYNQCGTTFNINSPKQLGEVLFEKMHLPVIKKTKSGYSTSVEVLEKLRGYHAVIDMIMEYRHLVKLKGTYADGLLAVIDKDTNRIHSNFNQTVTLTGRISSTEPNLQNIPIRTELGREVRKMFIPSDTEHILVDADYSQIELRVLAHISGDKNMSDAFNNNEDIHKMTASRIFGVPLDEVTPQMRSRAKTVNFGIIYGMGDFSLANEINVKKYEAKEYIESYFQKFSGIKKYMDDIVKNAKKDGYVTTILNRRRYLPELNGGNFIQRSFGERVAMNTPIQGSAADIIKVAMVKIYNRLKKENLKSHLILQVHDELIIDTFKNELETVKNILKSEMENAVKLNIPLIADTNAGESWYEAK